MPKDLRVSARVLAERNDRALVLAVLEPAYGNVNQTDPATFRVLRPGQRLILPVAGAAFAIESGSSHAYLYYDNGAVIRETIAALKAIGARKAAKVFADAMAIFPRGNPPRDTARRQKVMDAMPEAQLDAALDKIDKRFYALVETEIFRHAGEYIRKHPSDFVRDDDPAADGLTRHVDALKPVVGRKARTASPAALRKLASRGAPAEVVAFHRVLDWTGGYIAVGDVALRDLDTVLALNSEGLAAQEARAAKFLIIADTIDERNVVVVAKPGCERGPAGSVWLLLAAHKFEELMAHKVAPDYLAFLDEMMAGTLTTEKFVTKKKGKPTPRWSTAALPDYTEVWDDEDDEDDEDDYVRPKLPTWKAGGPLFVAKRSLIPVLGREPLTRAQAGATLIRYMKEKRMIEKKLETGIIWLDPVLRKAFKPTVMLPYGEIPDALDRQLKPAET